MRGLLVHWSGRCSRVGALLVLTLFHQLYLPPQEQDFLLLLRQRIIEHTHGILLVSHLDLYLFQLLS